ncbi:MAG: MBL fold metallo-hydrolase [Lachnospiraceae bacterium]|nr:MBL fold metallo-hydrolase [Lachnospiraceae bacterium]MCD8010794.1 MBL fold metallo-hydrolase [Lachnospiraceae bacterium]
MKERTFNHWQIAKDTYAIQCPGYIKGPGELSGWGYVITYLLIGSERALLQDTGFGNADLKGYVERLTEKPLVVVNSHVHPDHSGGNRQFGEILILEEERETEEPVYFEQEGEKERCESVNSCKDYRFCRVPAGTVLHLGDREVELLRLEGHTKGSMILFDRKTKLVFSGDAILKRCLLLAGLPLSAYRAALVRLQKHGGYEDIWGAHWYQPLGKNHVERVLALIDSYDPEKVEIAAWDESGGDRMVITRCGNAFEERDFTAIGIPESCREDMLR